MHAGLITGFSGTQSHIPVIGINVSRGKAEQEEKVAKLVDETSAHVGIPNFISRDAVTCFDEYVETRLCVTNAGNGRGSSVTCENRRYFT